MSRKISEDVPTPAFHPAIVKAPKSIVCPIGGSPGETHFLEDILNGPLEEMPILKSVGFFNMIPGRQSQYVHYIIHTQGDRVLKIEVGEPNMRGIASDASKIDWVSLFDGDDQPE